MRLYIYMYLRNGSNVYGVLADCSKAFDTVKHSKMLKAQVPSFVFRLLINQYSKQRADVRWDGEYSRNFKISNGVRQVAVLSPILYCFYMNELFQLLRNSKSGCQIVNTFAGVFGYADDLLLISPSRSGLQETIHR